MTGANGLQVVYLLAVLGLTLGTVRAHQLGARRLLVMALVWICIFLVTAGIAGFIDGWAHQGVAPPPVPDTDPNFT